MHREILGAAIGIGAGLLTLMTFIVASTGWLLGLVVPEVAVPWAARGLCDRAAARSASAQLKRFWMWLAVAIACWPLAVLGGWGAVKSNGSSLAICQTPGREHAPDKSVTVIAFDNNPVPSPIHIDKQYARCALRYYSTELPLGWDVLPVR